MLTPIATGASIDVVADCAAGRIPRFDRITEVRLRRSIAEGKAIAPDGVKAAKAMLVLTDCEPIVATNPAATVPEIPPGGVKIDVNNPFASVTPWSMLSIPSLEDIVKGSPTSGLPDASLADTIACHGPVGSVAVAGVASIVSEATDASWIVAVELLPPPGDGLVTPTDTEVPEARAGAGKDAVSSVAETNVVVAAIPLNQICDVETKLLPVAVISVAGDPTARFAGDTELSTGTELFTVKLSAFDDPPPGEGFVTTTGRLPAVAWSLVLRGIVN